MNDRVTANDKNQADVPWFGGKNPAAMSSDEFIKLHNTGFIESRAYEDYERPGGLAWLGTPDKYPVLAHALTDSSGKHYEVRKSGALLSYTKRDGFGEIVRGQNGLAEMMTADEIAAKGLPTHHQTMVVFDGESPIGFASNEWGAVGVWVEGPYQRKSIGSKLLALFMCENPRMRIGQMTDAGVAMTAAAHKILSASGISNSSSSESTTAAFKTWFGDSIVVTADGQPMVVYHGSPHKFSKFDISCSWEGAAYFTANKEIAKNFAQEDGEPRGVVMEVYLSLKNPKIIRATDIMASGNYPGLLKVEFDKARAEGHDGALLVGVEEFGGTDVQYAVFSAEQIEPAQAISPPQKIHKTVQRNRVGTEGCAP